MKNLLIVLLLAASVWAQDKSRSRNPRMAKGTAKDRQAITLKLEEMAKSWNAGDVAAYGQDVADGMDFTDAAGAVFTSREAYQQHLALLFRSAYKGAHADFQIRRIYFARPRVVLADADVTITKYHGLPPGISVKKGQPLRFRLKYVFSSEPKGWLILSGQETGIVESK